ncbi:hypothetical protein [Horticoccus sp. 23ND18S-11]|uniref:hypothetical protein n=1 Tax=Horticoccus sp. 23ND18S-11 TaxID=3391832 RepID=UPI0039C9BA9C
MNHREPPHAWARCTKALCCLSLLLGLTMTPHGVHAFPRLHLAGAIVGRTADPIPYLVAAGAPPLRFQSAPVPPEPAPIPAPVTSPGTVPATPETTSAPTPASPATSTAEPVAPVAQANASTGEPSSTAEPSQPSGKSPPAILPDDVRPSIRPEDFLPFFQVPGSGRRPATVNVVVPAPNAAPAPAPLPPSSATYTQTPK